MSRLAFVAGALIASATCAARPMVVHESRVIDAPAGYYFFGYQMAIDGDWAMVAAATPSPTREAPQQTHDVLLFHFVNGHWVLDRILAHRVATEYGQIVQFTGLAINNGVAVIGTNPTQVFKRNGDDWTEIAHPFDAPPGDPDFVSGELLWDGDTLLGSHSCSYPAQPLWGALISRLNSDGTWTPLERIAGNDPECAQSPWRWSLSGGTAIASSLASDYHDIDQMRIFRRNGTTWSETSVIDALTNEADVRGDEYFLSHYRSLGTQVYRNDDTRTLVDRLLTVSTSYDEPNGGNGLMHSSDVFMQDEDLFRKNAAGRYEHVATLSPTREYSLITEKLNGNRVIAHAWRPGGSNKQSVVFFNLPATYKPSPVIATGFGNGVSPFMPQLGTFSVATSNGNRVYRQSSVEGEYRAVLPKSDWLEQSIEADIKPTAFSGSDRWVGLAVRYQDAANYDYVTLRNSGSVEIKSMRNGVWTTVAHGTFPVVTGRSYHVSLQVVRTSLRVRIDGNPVVSTGELTPLTHGSVALLGYKAAADYDNVVVAQLGQVPIYDLQLGDCRGPLTNIVEWTASSGAWNCASSNSHNVVHQTSTEGDARAIVGTPTDDQVIMSRARLTSANGQDRWIGIAARYVDASNYYYLTLRTSNTVSLRKLVNGTIVTLGTANLTVTPNAWYDLRLDAVGNELRAFVNGAQVLQATDASHASGQGGLLTYKAAAEYQSYFAWQP